VPLLVGDARIIQPHIVAIGRYKPSTTAPLGTQCNHSLFIDVLVSLYDYRQGKQVGGFGTNLRAPEARVQCIRCNDKHLLVCPVTSA